MLNRTFSNKQILAVCALFALLATLIALPASLTQAQNKTAPKTAEKKEEKKPEKEPTIHDVVIIEGKGRFRLKAGYEFVRVSDSKVSVRRLGARVKIGDVGCGVCGSSPGGGNCSTNTSGTGGSCKGCGKTPNTDCTIKVEF